MQLRSAPLAEQHPQAARCTAPALIVASSALEDDAISVWTDDACSCCSDSIYDFYEGEDSGGRSVAAAEDDYYDTESFDADIAATSSLFNVSLFEPEESRSGPSASDVDLSNECNALGDGGGACDGGGASDACSLADSDYQDGLSPANEHGTAPEEPFLGWYACCNSASATERGSSAPETVDGCSFSSGEADADVDADAGGSDDEYILVEKKVVYDDGFGGVEEVITTERVPRYAAKRHCEAEPYSPPGDFRPNAIYDADFACVHCGSADVVAQRIPIFNGQLKRFAERAACHSCRRTFTWQ